MIIIKQATALTTLSALTLVSQTAEVAMTTRQDKKAVVAKKMVMVSLRSRFPRTRKLEL